MITVVAGFSPSWFARPLVTEYSTNPLTPLVISHGIVFSSWIIFFAIQVTQVGIGRVAQHRAFGKITLFVLPIMLVNGLMVGLAQAARGEARGPIPSDVFLLLPICEILAATILIYLGWYDRRISHVHKRIMMLAIAVMLGTATGRLLGGVIGTFLLPIPFILAIWCFDMFRYRKLDRRVVAAGVLSLASYAIPITFGFSTAWRSVSAGLISWWMAIA